VQQANGGRLADAAAGASDECDAVVGFGHVSGSWGCDAQSATCGAHGESGLERSPPQGRAMTGSPANHGSSNFLST
jgi:hypothetical protein